MLGTILIIILVLLLIGALPTWPYSAANPPGPGWGYWPSGLIGVILIILVLFLLLGHRF